MVQRARFALGIALLNQEARQHPRPAGHGGLPFCPHGEDSSTHMEWWRNYQDPEHGLPAPANVRWRNSIREMVREHVQREVDNSPPEDREDLMADFSSRVDELWSWRETVPTEEYRYWRVEAIHYIVQAGAQGIQQPPEFQAGMDWDSTNPFYWWTIARRFIQTWGSSLDRDGIESTEYWRTEWVFMRDFLRTLPIAQRPRSPELAPRRRRRPALELPPGHPPNLHEQGSIYPGGVRRSARVAGCPPNSQPRGSISHVVRRSARIAARGPPPGPSTTTGPPPRNKRKREVDGAAGGVAVAGGAKRTKA